MLGCGFVADAYLDICLGGIARRACSWVLLGLGLGFGGAEAEVDAPLTSTGAGVTAGVLSMPSPSGRAII